MTELSTTADTETPEQIARQYCEDWSLPKEAEQELIDVVTNHSAELQRELQEARAVIDGAMDDTRSCEEISCEECNLRTQALRRELEEARAEVWKKAIAVCREVRHVVENDAKEARPGTPEMDHLNGEYRGAGKVWAALEAASKEEER